MQHIDKSANLLRINDCNTYTSNERVIKCVKQTLIELNKKWIVL